MTDCVLTFIRDQELLPSDTRVLVAVSGGRDSVALAHLLRSLGFSIGLAHVNYGLRGNDSNEDAALVAQLAKGWNIPHHVHDVPPGTFDTGSVQEKARKIRYGFFEEMARAHGYGRIATAHHADDHVETLFLNLLRGTGIRGLRGIPAKRGIIVRPLLPCTRADIDAYVDEHRLSYRDDASNAEDTYARNKIRHHLIPLLKELQPNALERLNTSLALIGKDGAALTAMTQSLVEHSEDGWVINLNQLPKQEPATWLYHCWRTFGLNRTQASDLLQAKQSGAIVESQTHTAVLKGGLVIVRTKADALEPIRIPGMGDYAIENARLRLSGVEHRSEAMPRSNDHVWMNAESLTFPLTLRTWQHGDRFRPLGCDYDVKVSDYLSDKKVDRLKKERTLVLCDANEAIIWVVGIQLSEKVKVLHSDTHVLSLELELQ